MDLTFHTLLPGRPKRSAYKHLSVPTSAELVPVVVAVPSKEDAEEDRRRERRDPGGTTWCCPNRGWRRLLLGRKVGDGVCKVGDGRDELFVSHS